MSRPWRNRILLTLGVAFIAYLVVGAYHSRLDGELLVAVGNKNLPAVRTLLERGADPNLRYTESEWIVYKFFVYDNQKRDLHQHASSATQWERIINPVKGLLHPDPRQWPMLSLTVYDNDSRITLALIEHGADVNVVGRDGDSSLTVACDTDNLPLVRSLIRAGAKVNGKPDFPSLTPLVSALFAYQRRNEMGLGMGLRPISERLALVRLLVESGADVNARNIKTNDGPETALDCYRLCGHKRDAIVDYLVQHGAVWTKDDKLIR